MVNKKIKWGILGLGKIANKFASDLQLESDAELYGVASRSSEKAIEFAKKYNAIKTYSSYKELAEDADIDIIYVATPHTFHFENAMMCLQNDKSVLCEKPMGMNASEVETMIAEAKKRNLFLMEGLWTRFIPATEKVIELIKNKTIGEVLFVKADFGFKPNYDPQGRLYNKKLGGGSLLDIGIYPVYLSILLLGLPGNIKAMARFTESGVDSYCSVLFDYENNSKAILESTIEADTPIEAYVYGTKGNIKLHKRFHHSEKLTVTRDGFPKEEIDLKYKGEGYIHEIEEVMSCLINNKTESAKLPLLTSLNLIALLDKIRNEIGLKY
ncbi:MAG: oxidoreductase [Marinilabiliales bacterium]|nr:MAG: oxidoreductase [Marinilabiliales bacterium]